MHHALSWLKIHVVYDNREMHVVPAFDQDVIDVYSNAYSRPGRMAPSYGLYRTIEEDVRDNAAFSKKELTIPVLAVGAEKGIAEGVIKSARAVAVSVTPLLFNHTGRTTRHCRSPGRGACYSGSLAR